MFEVTLKPEPGSLCAEARRNPSDQQLLERFVAQRDENAFACLVERYGRAVWRVCGRLLYREHDVEDAFQAVFLVLSDKAASIRKTGAVGSWLHGVAHRTAVRAKQNAERRREKEASLAQPTFERSAWSEAAARELQLMLDEEMDRLAEKYRAPFVLCCLEGMSKAEAAQELGWKEGTVSSRLAQARKLLQNRLARRGVTLSAVLAVGALTQTTASAAVPALLMQSTIQAALAPLAGQAACASPAALSLANGIIHTMALAKLKALVSLVLAWAVLITGTAVVASQLQPEPAKQVAAAPQQEPVVIKGPDEVLALAFSPDGQKLVTAGASQRGKFKLSRLILWDVASAKEISTLDGVAGIRALAYSPDGQTLACGEYGGTLRLRDAETGQALADLKGHQVGVNGVAFSSDGVHLVSAGLDKKIKLWDWRARKELREIVGQTEVYSVAFFHDGRRFAATSRDATARIFEIDALDNVAAKFSLRGHRGGVEMAAISPDDKELATASWDGTIKIWDADSGIEQARLGDGKTQAYSVAHSPDGKFIAGGLGNGKVHVWKTKTHELVWAFDAHLGSVWGLAFTPDSKTLASCSSDSTAKLWDLSAGEELATLRSGFSLQTPQPVAIDSKSGVPVFTDSALELRPGQLPPIVVPPPKVPTPTQDLVVEEPTKSHWKLWLALLIGVSIIGLVVLGIWARRRASNGGAPMSDEEAEAVGAVPITLSCSNCDKRLKVKATMAGKKVKCPQCGNVLEVASEPKTDHESRPTKFQWSSPVLIGSAMLVAGLGACVILAILAINEGHEKAVVENKKIEKEVKQIKEQAIETVDVPKSFPNLTDEGLSRFKGMATLRNLLLNSAPITDQGMKDVNTLTGLRNLSLSGTKVTDAGLASLTDLNNLDELRLDKLTITDAGLENLKAFPKLKKLTLWRDPITSAGMVHLRNLPLLEHLSLDETRVGDDGLNELHGLTNLRYISVWRTQVTPQGIEAFKKALPNVKVNK
jgi:RNA polymerase sigma factor (sigma-70 family)